MQNKISTLNIGNKLGFISLGIPVIVFMFIINWFFNITPYQILEGMPLMRAPYICSIGAILALTTALVLATNFIGAKILFLYALWICIMISITPLLCIYIKV
ncbi:hypothetical protein [uncultured Clostridium sp.]|uniref:hypothetical protein n=1 Tax=uncultured Clostridium sp. TaxID=59620 RepID=UPI0028ED4E01|nr:hypothetical protein [uncultured Clostridium sp.]